MAYRRHKGNLPKRAVEAGKVRLEIDEPSAEHGRHLVDRIAE
jgi:hypothetical protein